MSICELQIYSVISFFLGDLVSGFFSYVVAYTVQGKKRRRKNHELFSCEVEYSQLRWGLDKFRDIGFSSTRPLWRCCPKKFSRGSWQILLLKNTVTPGIVKMDSTRSTNYFTVNRRPCRASFITHQHLILLCLVETPPGSHPMNSSFSHCMNTYFYDLPNLNFLGITSTIDR